MSDRTFKFEITITDENGKVRTREHTFFRPSNVDRFDSEPFVALLTERVLAASRYDAAQMDLADEQNSDDNRADHEREARNSYVAEPVQSIINSL